MFRVNTDISSNFTFVLEELVGKLPKEINLQTLYVADKPNDKGRSANEFADQTVSQLGLKNGDMLYVNYESATQPVTSTSTPTSTTATTTANTGTVNITNTSAKNVSVPIHSVTTHGPLKVDELPIDQVLDKDEGLIPRPLSSMCRHGAKGMCEYCSPLPPWDENYRKEHAIKHISFHAYLKQQMEKLKSGGSYFPPLDTLIIQSI